MKVGTSDHQYISGPVNGSILTCWDY